LLDFGGISLKNKLPKQRKKQTETENAFNITTPETLTRVSKDGNGFGVCT
jgi:hypothetical protein